ncbi:MAG: SDR family oxidoreductase, partial [Stenotrophomonas sp.]
MTVLVSGATSQIGRFLLPRLVAAQRPVLALSRHAQPAQPGVAWWAADMRALPAPSQPWQAIVSFAPLDAWGDWLARQEVAPAAKIIVTSSMSVLTKQGSAQPDEQALVALLQRGEQNLAAQATRLGMQWTVLRPTLVYGAGVDRSLTPIVQRARRTRVFPIPMAHGLRQPVHADDIALAVMAALGSDAADGQVLQIGGGERLDYQQMFRRVHA